MQNGTLLDSSWGNDRESTYTFFQNYFNNPILKKIKDDKLSTSYMVRIKSMLNAPQYLIVMCEKDSEKIGSLFKLSQLKWFSLQTRKLKNFYDVHEHSYLSKNRNPFNQSIECIKRTPYYTTYKTPYKFTINLLHPEKDVYYYPNKGTICSALETYQTVIDVVD